MNALALAFIKAHEGCKLTAYQDGGGVWTIGWGATGHDICKGVVWTQEQADARLDSDIADVESALRRRLLTAHAPVLSAEQTAALISFIFNIGESAFVLSTLFAHIKDGRWLSAAKEFPRWDHDAGKDVKGLLLRRFEEATLFLRGSP